jgi:hypothetical protein
LREKIRERVFDAATGNPVFLAGKMGRKTDRKFRKPYLILFMENSSAFSVAN